MPVKPDNHNDDIYEQRSLTARLGPSFAPSIEISSHKENKLLFKFINELVLDRPEGSRGLCKRLSNAVTSKILNVSSEASLSLYLASGGYIPKDSIMNRLQVPALIPFHLLLHSSIRKKNNIILSGLSNAESTVSLSRSDSDSDETTAPTPGGLVRCLSEQDYVKSSNGKRLASSLKVGRHKVNDIIARVVLISAGLCIAIKDFTNNGNIGSSSSSFDLDADSAQKEVSKSKNCSDDSDVIGSVKASRHDILGKSPVIISEVQTVEQRAGQLYHQTDKVYGLYDHQGRKPDVVPKNVTFQDKIGVLMSPSVDTFVVLMACPVIDYVPFTIDPFFATLNGLCDMLRLEIFTTLVVDEIGLELICETHKHWRSTQQTSKWPVKLVITTSSLTQEFCMEYQRFLAEVHIESINDIQADSQSEAITTLLTHRGSMGHSLIEITKTGEEMAIIHPRPIGLSFQLHSTKLSTPVWSDVVMTGVAGTLSVLRSTQWKITSDDRILVSRFDLRPGEMKSDTNIEALAAFELSYVVIASGGSIVIGSINRSSSSGSDPISKLKPTIIIGTCNSWSAFARRLVAESGINDFSSIGRSKLRTKRVQKSQRMTFGVEESGRKREYLCKKLVDPWAFYEGRKFLGHSIRLVIVIDPVQGDELMHMKTVSTLQLLLSSKLGLEIVQAYTSGQPDYAVTTFLSINVLNQVVNQLSPGRDGFVHSCLPIETDDTTIRELQKKDSHPPGPLPLLDNLVSRATIVGCVLNGSISALFGSPDTEYLSLLPSRRSKEGEKQFNVTRTLRICSGQRDNAMLTGAFIQSCSNGLGGPIYLRGALTAAERTALRKKSLLNFFSVHCDASVGISGITDLLVRGEVLFHGAQRCLEPLTQIEVELLVKPNMYDKSGQSELSFDSSSINELPLRTHNENLVGASLLNYDNKIECDGKDGLEELCRSRIEPMIQIYDLPISVNKIIIEK